MPNIIIKGNEKGQFQLVRFGGALGLAGELLEPFLLVLSMFCIGWIVWTLGFPSVSRFLYGKQNQQLTRFGPYS